LPQKKGMKAADPPTKKECLRELRLKSIQVGLRIVAPYCLLNRVFLLLLT